MFALIVLMPFVSFCQEENRIKTIYPNMVGDIEFNKETDKENFELCYEKYISQYFNDSNGLEYKGGKGTIEKEFAEKYKSENIENESGLIRIRFVVNCKGVTDRFRLLSMDRNYNEKVFSKSITDQLLSITKSLKGWKVKKYKEKEIDYYQYLIFKIENGQLKEILP
ncbi:hypothetical protein [Flavobacterium sp. ZT3R18]|uniref:hypothetical protein n=1 Tax=Flavobacterium sp. ZT3R18 TaxID=2594429 RepID=UPI0021034BB0|nr:hypothetical protein [Flavobacterium sp. ZT3R18]